MTKDNEAERPDVRQQLKRAYGTSGLGLFDLIPGIRSLPRPVRLTLMIMTVTVAVCLLYWNWR